MSQQDKTTVFFIGNISRGDDAAAIILLEKLRLDPDIEKLIDAGELELHEVWQLNPEHVYDMQDSSQVIFVDADTSKQDNAELRDVVASGSLAISSHRVEPATLLAMYKKVFNVKAPAAKLLAIGASNFELDSPISDTTRNNIELASTENAVAFRLKRLVYRNSTLNPL